MTVTTAIIQAVFIYAILLLVVVPHVIVIYNWETGTGGEADAKYTVERLINPDPPSELLHWSETRSNESPSVEEMEALVDQINSLPTTQGTKVEPARDLLKVYASKLYLLEDYTEPESFLTEGNQRIPTLRLFNLLQRESLSSITDITSLVTASLKELQGMVDGRQDAKWHTLELDAFPQKEQLEWEDLKRELCQVVSDSDEDEEESEDEEYDDDDDEYDDDDAQDDQDPVSHYVQESDLKKELHSLKYSLEDRQEALDWFLQNNKGIQTRLDNATTLLQQQFTFAHDILEAAVDETADNLAQIWKSKQRKDDPNCDTADEEDIEALLEAGLEAMARHLDIRDALMELFREMDPEAAKDLILDADLLDTDPQLPKPSTAFPALRVLDSSPLIHQLANLIDKGLDRIGGYVDPLDHYLDQLSEQLEPPQTLGQVWVKRLLVKSGHWNVPMPTGLRQFLQNSGPRGQAWLEALA